MFGFGFSYILSLISFEVEKQKQTNRQVNMHCCWILMNANLLRVRLLYKNQTEEALLHESLCTCNDPRFCGRITIKRSATTSSQSSSSGILNWRQKEETATHSNSRSAEILLSSSRNTSVEKDRELHFTSFWQLYRQVKDD